MLNARDGSDGGDGGNRKVITTGPRSGLFTHMYIAVITIRVFY